MVGKVRELIAALCDPRLMKEFKILASLLDLDFSIPSFKKGILPQGKLVVADDECIKSYGLAGYTTLTVNELNLAKVMLNLSGRPADILLVGVDPGKKLAYVVITGGVICSRGYASSFRELLKIIKSLAKKLKPEKVIIKVGERGKDKAVELSQLVNDGSYEFYVVGEDRTNTRNLYLMREASIKLDKDCNAALNIALRDGLRINAF